MDLFIETYGNIKSFRSLHFELGRTHLSNEEPTKALEEFIKAATNKEHSESYLNGGEKPKNWEINYCIGKSYENIGGKDFEAIKAYLMGIQEEGGNNALLYDQACNLLTSHSAKKVISWIESLESEKFQFLPLEDAQVSYHQFFAELFFLSIDFPSSKEHVENLLSIDPLNQKGKQLQHKIEGNEKMIGISSLIQQKSFAEAEKEISILKEWVPDLGIEFSCRFEFLTLKLAYEEGKWEEHTAEGQIRSLNQKINVLISKVLAAEDIEASQRSLALEAYILLIKTCLAHNQYVQALNELDKAFSLDSLNTQLLLLKIQILIEGQEDIEEGARLLKHIPDRIEINERDFLGPREGDGNAYLFLAYLYFYLEKAEELVDKYLEKAKNLGLREGSDSSAKNYLDLASYLLAAEKNLSQEQYQPAVVSYFQVAQRYGWRGNFEKSVGYFEIIENIFSEEKTNYQTIVAAESDFQIFYWLYANHLYLISNQEEPPYWDLDLLLKAKEIFEKSPKIAIENSFDLWAYETIAFTHKNLVLFDGYNGEEQAWNSVYFLERSLIHESSRIRSVINQAKNYGYLGLFENGLNLLNELEKHLYSEMDKLAWNEELTIILLNKGEYTKANSHLQTLIEKTEDASQKARYYGWQGFIKYNEGIYGGDNGPLKDFEKDIQANPDDPWSYGMKMNTLWMQGKFKEAIVVAEEIEELLSDMERYPRASYELGSAKYFQGELEEAKFLLEKSAGQSNLQRIPSTNLLFVYLRLEDKQADSEFDRFMLNQPSHRTLKDFEAELLLLKNNSHIFLTQPTQKELLEKWIEIVQSSLDNYNPDMSMEEELEWEIQHFSPPSLGWLGIMAAKARIKQYQKAYGEALQLYEELLPYKVEFPEVDLAIQNIEKDLLKENQSLIQNTHFQKTIENCALIKGNYIEKDIQLTFSYLGLSETKLARESMLQTLESLPYKEQIQGYDLERYSKIFSIYISSSNSLIQIEKLIQDCLETNQEESKKLALEGILGLVESSWSGLLNGFMRTPGILTKPTDPSLLLEPAAAPILRPLTIEFTTPAFNTNEYGNNAINTYIPDLRNFFLTNFGISLPGVKFQDRYGQLRLGTFRILINEFPSSSGIIHDGYIFAMGNNQVNLDTLGIPYHQDISNWSLPGDGWVLKSERPKLESAGILFWENPFRYMLQQLKIDILEKLDWLHTLDDSYKYLLAENKQFASENAQKILSSPQQTIRFHQVLKSLLKEQVSIADKKTIISTFCSSPDKKELKLLTQDIRLQIKASLPFNRNAFQSVKLPFSSSEVIRTSIKSHDQKSYLILEKDHFRRIYGEIKSLTAPFGNFSELYLEVENTSIRPFLAELLEKSFPRVKALASEEFIRKTP